MTAVKKGPALIQLPQPPTLGLDGQGNLGHKYARQAPQGGAANVQDDGPVINHVGEGGVQVSRLPGSQRRMTHPRQIQPLPHVIFIAMISLHLPQALALIISSMSASGVSSEADMASNPPFVSV